MTSVPHNSAKIDRLSSLPPELLLFIFDLAYDPDQLLLEPLSKTLLPYFRESFYRRIRISSRSSWSKLLRTVKASPSLAKLVLDLDTSSIFTVLDPGQFGKIVEPFPRLVFVKTGYLEPLPSSPSFTLPPLRNLSYQCDQILNADLATISRLSRLTRLNIDFIVIETSSPLPSAVVFTALKSLTLHRKFQGPYDEPEWPRAAATLISRCPDLTQLKLSDHWLPNYGSLLPLLKSLHPRLERLEAATSDTIDSFYGLACDLHLPLFVNLRHLDLADNTIGSSLCRYLRQLPHLSFLRLGKNTHLDGPPPSELLSLVQGSTKLVSLTVFVLDCLDGKVGDRLSWEDALAAGENRSNHWNEWRIPEFEAFALEDARQLPLAGHQNGIDVCGTALEAVEVWDAYLLESTNREILEAYKTGSFDGLSILTRDYDLRFSIVDYNQLDSNNLKLVKIDLPEENWFMLSLE